MKKYLLSILAALCLGLVINVSQPKQVGACIICGGSAGTAFSTSEVDTGSTWGGSIIYAKQVSVGALPNNTTTTDAHGITGLGIIIPGSGCVADNGTLQLPLPYLRAADTLKIQVYFDDTNITIVTNTDYSAYTGECLLFYTKT